MPVTITELEIPGVLLVECGCFFDDRGFFSEIYSEPVWCEAGFTRRFVQDNLSLSRKGTLRGMHYQLDPNGMGKLVHAIKGAAFDVGVDLREGSPTFGKWIGRELNADNRYALWFPAGFAHGFVALEDETLVYYKCDSCHAPDAERSLCYNDPAVGIEWPAQPTIISDKDATAPLLADAEYNFKFQPSS
ncbi:MAG: dTDP-4-dehydrorhamnose 3,5-epimerase [Nitrospiraceae bacterium]|nr:dTDP-4-dehydrorhamnose 3,5-epimerase [Nitrospiraceae bacterium]